MKKTKLFRVAYGKKAHQKNLENIILLEIHLLEHYLNIKKNFQMMNGS